MSTKYFLFHFSAFDRSPLPFPVFGTCTARENLLTAFKFVLPTLDTMDVVALAPFKRDYSIVAPIF